MNERVVREINAISTKRAKQVHIEPGIDYSINVVEGCHVVVKRYPDEILYVHGQNDLSGFAIVNRIPDGVRGGTINNVTRIFEDVFGTNTPDQHGSITFTKIVSSLKED